MKIADNCDECGKEFGPYEFKALMNDYTVLCKQCYYPHRRQERKDNVGIPSSDTK